MKGKQPVAVILREYYTLNYTDLKLYDRFSLMLDDAKDGDEFRKLIEGVRVGIPDGVLSVYDLTDIVCDIKVIKE